MEIFIPKNGILIDINSQEKYKIIDILAITKNLDFVVGYRLGPGPVLKYGLGDIVGLIKNKTKKPIIYDHQKFGIDTPEACTGGIFEQIKDSGIVGIVIFPLSNKEWLKSIVNKCRKIDLLPIVCGDVSHSAYFLSRGKYTENDLQQKIYFDAVSLGVSHLIMPSNSFEKIKLYCHQLEAMVGQLKIFFTAISNAESKSLLDVCGRLKQNNAYAIFDIKLNSLERYGDDLSAYWDNFRKKVDLF